MTMTTRQMASKVPEVTIFFWIIKVLSTTVGESAADTLNADFGLGLTGTTLVMTAVLVLVAILQFRADRYVPWIYWLLVVLVSIVGTLITDILTDNLGVPLEVTTVVFVVALGATFAVWRAMEGTLSIRSITTTRREAFYWLVVLFTFALGTAAGDLVAEQFGLGYLATALIVGAIIAAIAALHYGVGLDGVLTFWLVYILTRPLGASLGDLLSQDRDAGGLGLGATATTALFTAVIVALVGYVTYTGVDRIALVDKVVGDEADALG
ncbi:hypothetical protein OG921_21335 [Aldersonia sp. NBC_00410]|uniref:COG4705 family protein n=1 Tax=Aldersonia sp. NBC_00410 TaxID=2975954 RepID=UPI002252D4B9|nr:hypothetical protein [Aldersonia sp. NBC_00410]MCX5045713.1 hypothetical protein [Aldersonia sp. NBC_00410]